MESGVPPSYDAASAPPPEAPGHSGPQQYPPTTTPYPQQSSAPYPTSAQPAYPMKTGAPQGAPPGYPPQGPPPGYPPQGPPPGYPSQGPPPPGYPYSGYPGHAPQGAAAGYTTQGVPVNYNQTSHQTTIITQQPGGVTLVAQVPPSDHFALSIVSMFCCFFIGIFALLNSIKSRERLRLGDSTGAFRYGLSAKRLATSAIVTGILIYVTFVISRERFRMGDYAGATQFGMSARRLATISIVTAICLYVTLIILRIILEATFTGRG